MRIKRKGVQMRCTTFRVVPDEMLEMQRTGKISATSTVIFCHLQRYASDNKRTAAFREFTRYCGFSHTTVSRALKELMTHGFILKLPDGTYAVNYNAHLTQTGLQTDSDPAAPKNGAGAPENGARAPKNGAGAPENGARQVQNRPGDIKKHIETMETGYYEGLHASRSREGDWQSASDLVSKYISSKESPSSPADFEPAYQEAIAQFQSVFGFIPKHDTPHARNLIALCLAKPDGKATARYLKELKP